MDFVMDTIQAFGNPFVRNKQYFDNQLSEYVYYSKYSKWRGDLGRREVWEETVRRAIDYLEELSEGKLSRVDYKDMFNAMLNMEVMPSMRLLAMAGVAGRRENLSLYNCAALPIDSIDSIVEVMYLSMNGTGIGFSVEKQFVKQFPKVEPQRCVDTVQTIVIADSTEGWCDAFKAGLNAWWNGLDVLFDYSKIRPAGAILKIKGGTSSGYLPLKSLLDFTRELLLKHQGKKLDPIDVYDVVNKIGDCVVMGGSRRTASLALFDYDDTQMLQAKNVDYWNFAPWRVNSNNSAVWPQDRDLSQDEVDAFFEVMNTGSNGEPGIFSRRAVMAALPERRSKDRIYGTNACGEAILPLDNDGGGLCNLSSIVARAKDSRFDLFEKARIASIIGTIQSTATNFHYVRKGWKRIAEEERLLGVDLTGHFDSSLARNPSVQRMLKNIVIDTNRLFAKRLGINQSVATTVVKPSGNSGALLNVSSGVHPRWSRFYVRNVRVNVDSPFFGVLNESGAHLIQENDKTFVVGFPIRVPDGSITRHQITALQHLEYWKQTKTNYAEHSVSCTVYYTPDEIDAVKKWIFDNQAILTGLSFLPRFDAAYANAPFVEIDEHEFEKQYKTFPQIDFSLLTAFDAPVFAAPSQEVACSANKCELVL